MSISMEFEGELAKAIDDATRRQPQRVVEALHKSVYEVEAPAARSAMELFNHPTGNLPSSIHSEVDAREFIGKTGTSLVYARLREKGGIVHGAWGRATTHHVGRPFLVPALEKTTNKIKSIFKDLCKDVVDDIAKGSK